jgi:hypothetical protein
MPAPVDAGPLLQRSERVSISVGEVAQAGLDDARLPQRQPLSGVGPHDSDRTTERSDYVGVGPHGPRAATSNRSCQRRSGSSVEATLRTSSDHVKRTLHSTSNSTTAANGNTRNASSDGAADISEIALLAPKLDMEVEVGRPGRWTMSGPALRTEASVVPD